MRIAAVIVGLVLCAGSAGSAIAAQSTFTFEAGTDRRVYAENAASEIFVEARMHAPQTPELEGTLTFSRNVAFVVDRSGSMAGEHMAAMQRALLGAVHQLAASDIVSVVCFGSEVETVIAAQRRDQLDRLENRIMGIVPEGGAALYDALNQGAAQLRRHAGPDTIDHLILVCDGPATKGPREFEDFIRLAEVFAREGITVSTLGLGPECEEDLLSALARVGAGHFRYIVQPERLDLALLAEIDALNAIVARDVVVTIEFGLNYNEVRSYSWAPATVEGKAVIYRAPRIVAGQTLRLLASGVIEAFRARFIQDVATVRIQWRELAGGEARERVLRLPINFTTDLRAVRDSIDPGVWQAVANARIRESLQSAIEQIDRGEFRLALRELRRGREAVLDLNYNLDDAAIAEASRALATYIADLETREMDSHDRKILRTGLSGRFDPPVPDDKVKP